MYAIGVVETLSIPLGILAGDQMMKAAAVSLVSAQTVCAGKYIVVVSGEVAAVRSSVSSGAQSAAHGLVDQLIQTGNPTAFSMSSISAGDGPM